VLRLCEELKGIAMSKIRAATRILAAMLSLFGFQAYAQGVITFSDSVPAVVEAGAIQDASGAPVRARTMHTPGINRVSMPPVTPEASEAAIRAQPIPANLNPGVSPLELSGYGAAAGPFRRAQRVAGDAAPAAPASIAELARALRNDVDLIYEHVRNNVEYMPMWGIKKGAVGAILDNQGTAFDQATLMVHLLRAAGYSASYVKGRLNLSAGQVSEWFGVDTANVCAVLNLLGHGRIPISNAIASAAGSCPGSTAALVSLKVDHVWVKVNIGGSNYYFDPSYKPHVRKTGINLTTVTGYNAATIWLPPPRAPRAQQTISRIRTARTSGTT
jgi:hypothetical protein